MHGTIILAETAVQLYRDTDYRDLISFEEDIARIAAIVLVIAESPGSFAELGAFASNETIRKALRIIMQERYWNEESFIRHGPVEKIKKVGDEFVGVYPWRTNRAGSVVLRSVAQHYTEIVKFINKHTSDLPRREQFPKAEITRLFYIIYWVIYLSMAISTGSLYNIVQQLIPGSKNSDIRNKMYCMQIAGWIGSVRYSGKDYFFVRHDMDPFSYSFKDDVAETDVLRRRAAVAAALTKSEKAPRHVRILALDGRKGA